MPMPVMQYVRTTVATTYQFKAVDHEGKSTFGWALCTVNDQTGELNIQSDWGSWSHRWGTGSFGERTPNLTAFLGDLDHTDYVARKLNNEGTLEREFCAIKTTANIKRHLLEVRLDHGRNDENPFRWKREHLSRDRAREIWDELGELEGEFANAHDQGSAALYYDRIPDAVHHFVSDLYEDIGYRTKPECIVLRQAILPALFAACRATMRERRLAEASRLKLMPCTCDSSPSPRPCGGAKGLSARWYCDKTGEQGLIPVADVRAPERATCRECGGTGIVETGNNDLPCDCPAGDRAMFNVVAHGAVGTVRMTGAALKEHLRAHPGVTGRRA